MTNKSTSLPFRVGHGYDIHRLVEGRPLILGGILIPSPKGLEGHSDADALTHALADAILGAMGLPDIGHYFPNNDEAIRGINSQKILEKALQEANAIGYSIANVDISLIAETPKMAPHLPAIKSMLAKTLGITTDCIGLKVTTNEGQDAIGRKEAIAAHAIALLQKQ